MDESPQLIWDIGTAYDMFMSLEVLHEPSRFGLRGSWAAGVRSRLPGAAREMLQQMQEHPIWPIPWVTTLPGTKDGENVLQTLQQIPAVERLPALAGCSMSQEQKNIFADVAGRGRWQKKDVARLKTYYKTHYKSKGKKSPSEEKIIESLALWANAEESGEQFLNALQAYYEAFFAEEERRIWPALEKAVAYARELAQKLALPELLEELSQGLRISEAMKAKELLMVPSFWSTPLALFTELKGVNEKQSLFMFGARPANMSLVPGEVVPDALFQALKALADPTRLRILHYLSTEPLTPAQLARRLRLRAPTVIHHLDTLRLARLVYVTLGSDGRRYAARYEAITAAFTMLEEFLNADDGEESAAREEDEVRGFEVAL